MACTRTDAHTIGECPDYPSDPKVQAAFKLALDDMLANGHWNPELDSEYRIAESELRLLYGDK